MTNNRGDKIIKAQVDSLQVSFDKEAAWMRLQDRLESKDGGKGYSRAGWAAAAMLIVATVLWFSLSDTDQKIVVGERVKAVQAVHDTPAAEHKVTDTKMTIQTATVITASKKEKKLFKSKGVKQALPEVEEVVMPAVIEPPMPEVEEVIVKAKPKLRTVHINEVIEEEKIERVQRNSRYAIEKYNYDELYDDPYIPKNPFKITISRQN